MITDPIKKKIQTVVNVFETSSLKARYDVICIADDGPGKCTQISYGKQQCAEFGNLNALIKMYCDTPGARYGKDLKNYLQFIGDPKHPLCKNQEFKQLLKLAGTDATMHQVQDEFFDRYYWNPALNFFSANIFTLSLSMAVIYDSYIHSGGIPAWLRNDFPEKTPLKGGNEMEWINEYVTTRDNWLEHNSRAVLRGTDYRTDAWIEQIKEDNWMLEKPVVVKFNSSDQREWVTII